MNSKFQQKFTNLSSFSKGKKRIVNNEISPFKMATEFQKFRVVFDLFPSSSFYKFDPAQNKKMTKLSCISINQL